MSAVNSWNARITGLGSVSPPGPCRGLIGARAVNPRIYFEDPVRGGRRAFMVEPFRPGDVVPGLKTRRLDRLSVWSLVAAHLALQDARIDLEKEDRSRFAVVFGTGYGCIELTEAYFKTVAGFGYAKADPIVFPETLDNSPASHVARVLGLRGPNITLSCRGVSGESALIQGASLLGSGEADRVLVLAGDTLSRPLYEWFDAARVLSDACYADRPEPASPLARGTGFVPGEGLAGVVLESGSGYADRGVHAYCSLKSGCMGSNPGIAPSAWGECPDLTAVLIRSALGDDTPADVKLVVGAANGSARLDLQEAEAIRRVFGPRGGVTITAPKTRIGEFDGNAVLRLIMALPGSGNAAARVEFEGVPGDGRLLMLLGASAGGSRAVLCFSLPGSQRP